MERLLVDEDFKVLDESSSRRSARIGGVLWVCAAVVFLDFLCVFGEFVGVVLSAAHGETARDALQDDVVDYAFTSSCFDLLVLAALRTCCFVAWRRP